MTYLLVVMVLAVWGLIGHRIYSSLNEEPDIIDSFQQISRAKLSPNDYELIKDTAKLQLNYRDPFNPAEQIQIRPVTTIKSLPTTQFVVREPLINWSMIKYSGFVRNPGSNKLIALININGKNVMLSEGEKAEEVKLLRNMKDSVKVAFRGRTKFIIMK